MSDHETTDRKEGMEKVNSGLMLMIREGTSAKNLEELLPLVNDKNARRFCFVSDDLHPQDIKKRGHLNYMIKKALKMGMNPITAIQLATLNPAEYFGLKYQGAIAPGYRADLVVLSDLDEFTVDEVYKDGRLVAKRGDLVGFPHESKAVLKPKPLNIPDLKLEDFIVNAQGTKARIIELIPGQIMTKACYEKIRTANGFVISDIERDILKLAVVERHRATGRIGIGLVRGFGLRKGAIASSVAHDSHNVIVVGVKDQDIYRAVEEIKSMGGGIVVVNDDEVLARTPLEVAGLMSREPVDRLIEQLHESNRAAASLGCAVQEPFMSLSFLALPVIPELKLTDMGLVDVEKSSLVSLFMDDMSVL
jgi:adenine deaminase